MRYLFSGLAMVLIVGSLSGCHGKTQGRIDREIYFATICEKEGYPKGSPEHPGCVDAKANMTAPPASGGGGGGKSTVTCHQRGGITQCF